MKLLRAVSSAREKAQQLMADNQWGQAVPALKEALALVPDIRVYQAEITVQLCESISKGLFVLFVIKRVLTWRDL